MKITATSPLTGKENALDIDITLEQLKAWQDSSTPIQKVFPHLSADEREFLLTGLAPGEFEQFVGPEELEDDDMASKGDSHEI